MAYQFWEKNDNMQNNQHPVDNFGVPNQFHPNVNNEYQNNHHIPRTQNNQFDNLRDYQRDIVYEKNANFNNNFEANSNNFQPQYNKVPINNGFNQAQFNMNNQPLNYGYPQTHYSNQAMHNQNSQIPSDFENNRYAPNTFQRNDNYNPIDNNIYYRNFSNPNPDPQFNNVQQQFVSNGMYGYNQAYNYGPVPYNQYHEINNQNYGTKYKHANIIEKPLAREIRNEKWRNVFLLLISITGILITSFMLAVFYRIANFEDIYTFLGMEIENVMYPALSIFLLLISIACFIWASTDLALLLSSVSRFKNSLGQGNEVIPYFITRNYKNLISRSVYINWIAFSTYIIGSICLAILYALEGQFQYRVDNNLTLEVDILFWTIGVLKSFRTDIIINIIVLFSMFGIHIFNIVFTRKRKNNIAGYYNYEPIPANEILAIKKRANKICLIIMLVVIAIILFLIIIPWLIVRKSRGQSLKLWSWRK